MAQNDTTSIKTRVKRRVKRKGLCVWKVKITTGSIFLVDFIYNGFIMSFSLIKEITDAFKHTSASGRTAS
jgi:hypothetical protein